jgi:hypothetical protein
MCSPLGLTRRSAPTNIGHDVESDKYTIEHIIPESPEENWQDFNELRDSSFIYRLGNYTLLSDKDNRDIGNMEFKDKKTIYENSEFEITKKIAEDNNSWDIERIANRQRTMANWAASIWKLA